MGRSVSIACWLGLLPCIAAVMAAGGCNWKSGGQDADARPFKAEAYWIRKPFAVEKLTAAPDSVQLIRARDATRRERSSFSLVHGGSIKSQVMLAHSVRRFAQVDGIGHYLLIEVAPAQEGEADEYGILNIDDPVAVVQWYATKDQAASECRAQAGYKGPIDLVTFDARKPNEVWPWLYACIPQAAAGMVILLATMRLAGYDRLRLMLAGLALTAAAEAAVQWYMVAYTNTTMFLGIMGMILGALGLGHLFVGPSPKVRVMLPASLMTIVAMAVGGIFATIVPAFLLELILFG